MSTKSSYLTSPIGEIQFMALAKPVKKYIGNDAPLVYTIRLKFDGSTNEGKAWKKEIEKINPNLIGTKHTNSSTEFTVRASTKFEVKVTDSKGNELEEAPMFFGDSKGTAKMVVEPWTGNSMGGSINLAAVVIDTLDNSTSGGDRESKLDALKATLAQATK